MMIQGKSCTLTVAKDSEYYPLPYSEETVRQASKGYALPGVIGIRNREQTIITRRTIQGCVVTMLEYQNVWALFLLLFYYKEYFDLLADRVAEKIVYKNLTIKSFELRGENGKPLHFRFDVKETDDTYTESWPIGLPSLKWNAAKVFIYDGHTVIADLKTLPLVYRFTLTGNYTEKAKYKVILYFPLSEDYFPTLGRIDKLKIMLDAKTGVWLDLYDLVALDDMADINCADTVLCYQTFYITGKVVLNIRNQNECKTVVL